MLAPFFSLLANSKMLLVASSLSLPWQLLLMRSVVAIVVAVVGVSFFVCAVVVASSELLRR